MALLAERRADDEFVLQAVLTLAAMLQHEPLRTALFGNTQVHGRPANNEQWNTHAAANAEFLHVAAALIRV